MGELVGKTYAVALFDAASDLDKINDFNNELSFLRSVFDDEKELINLLSHPRIKKDEKKDLISRIFKGKISLELINLLYILVDKRRESYILDIVKEYKKLFNEYKNIVKVVAMTALPMEEDSKNRLVESLGKKLNKTVELTNEIDPSVIGGILLKIEDKIIDGTLKGQLDSISKVIIGTTIS